MSIANEISRIQEARDTLRAKAITLGVGLSTDNLTQLATKYDGIVDRGTPNAEVKEGESFTLSAGYYHGGSIKGVAGGGNYSLQSKTVTPTKSEQVVDNDAGYYGLDTVTVAPIPDVYQDVSSVTATVSDVLSPKVYVDSNGKVLTGTMQNRGAVSATLDTNTTSYSVPAGYHNGSGTVSVVPQTKSATPTKEEQTISADDGKVLSSVTVAAIPKQYADATDKTAVAANILSGKTAISWDPTEKAPVSITGTMEDNGAVSQTLSGAKTSYTIPGGYHNGNGTVSITIEEKTATPTKSSQDITPTTGKVLTKVTVNPIPANYGDTTDADAVAGDILVGKVAITNIDGVATEITGTMADNGTVTKVLDTTSGNQSQTIAAGKHSGSGKVSIVLEEKTATPSTSTQSITPTAGKVLSKVTVNPIPDNYGNTSDATGVAADVLAGKIVYGKDASGKAVKLTGTMVNNGATGGSIDGLTVTSYSIPAGYTTGGTVSLTNDIETALAAI